MTTPISVTLLIHGNNKQSLLLHLLLAAWTRALEKTVETHFSYYFITLVTWAVFLRNVKVDLVFYFLQVYYLMISQLLRLCNTCDRWMNKYGALMEWNWQGETNILHEIPVPVPLCPPQIPQRLDWDWIRFFKVRGMAWPSWFDGRYRHKYFMWNNFVDCLWLRNRNIMPCDKSGMLWYCALQQFWCVFSGIVPCNNSGV
jgi:hypothetical protein